MLHDDNRDDRSRFRSPPPKRPKRSDSEDGDAASATGAACPLASPAASSARSIELLRYKLKGVDEQHFRVLHAYCYLKSQGIEKMDFGCHTVRFCRSVFALYASGTSVEDQLHAAIKAQLTSRVAVKQLFTEESRQIPTYRKVLFSYFRTNYGKIKKRDDWRNIRNKPKKVGRQAEIWGLLCDCVGAKIYAER
ncbi:hypothetical protein JCM11641_004382 [Rhodosporidiobolus odoratus]